MKKILIIVIAAVMTLGVQQSKAQLDFGVVAGMNLNKASFKGKAVHNFRSDNRCGWFAGPKIAFTLPVVGIGVDASAQYSQRYVNMEDEEGFESTHTFKSIEVPINLRFQFGMKSILAGYIATGPQFGFNVGSKNIKSWGEDFKLKNSVMTWNIGAGIRALKHLEVGIGYNIALSKFAKITGTQESSIKSSSFQAHVGYYF